MIQYTSLSNITIPEKIKIISPHTFNTCTNLKTVLFSKNENNTSNVSTIGNRAFANCTELSNIPIPNGIIYIGRYTFSKCANLTNIDIPDSVKEIGWAAFEMTGPTSVEIPNSVTKIDHYAFYGCNSLTKVTFNLKAETSEDLKDYCNTLFQECNQHIDVFVPNGLMDLYSTLLREYNNITVYNAN